MARLLLIRLFPFFLAAAAAVLEARQVFDCGPHPIDCGGGYCCMQYYLCKPNGNSYLCIDELLTLDDGTEHTYTALNPSSDNAFFSSLSITFTTGIASTPATTTSSPLGSQGPSTQSSPSITALASNPNASATSDRATSTPNNAAGRTQKGVRVGIGMGLAMMIF